MAPSLNNFPIAGKRPHVAIIGAGFSGLSCADVLMKNGANVTIFEAKDRLGGRVRLQPFVFCQGLLTMARSSKPRSDSTL